MTKYLIITPKNGLCNQLLCIAKGIIFGIITNRDVIFKGFQLDYRVNENLCNISEIIDINYLQNILNNNSKLDKIKLYSNLDIKGTKIKTLMDTDICYIKELIPILFYNENKDIEYLDIGGPITADIPLEYDKEYKYINLNIKFTDKFINMASNIKNKLNLNNYTCIHLRLEDDAIGFMKDISNQLDFNTVNEIYKNKYLNELDYLKNNVKDINHKIYICTSLNIENNHNNNFYKMIKEKYNLLDKNDIIKLENENCDCREIYGIIDFIIAQDSIYFIGSDWSSYSIYIYESHIHKGKSTKLIDIWNYIKK